MPALGFRLGVREQQYECSQNIAVRSTFVRYSRSIIDGPYTNEPFVRYSYYFRSVICPFVRCSKLIWVIEQHGRYGGRLITLDWTDNRDGLEHRGRKSLLKQMVQCVCRVYIVHSPHARTASVRIHIAAPRPSHQDSSLSSVAPGFTPAVSSSPRIVPPPILP